MADEVKKAEEEPNEKKRGMIGMIVAQMMRVIASIGFGIIVGAFIYTQGDNALEYILQFIMQNTNEVIESEDPFAQGNTAWENILTFRMLISVGAGMVASVWFYSNPRAINIWINKKLGLALNVNFFKKRAELDKE